MSEALHISQADVYAMTRANLILALQYVDQHFWPPRPTRQLKTTLAGAVWRAVQAGRYSENLTEIVQK